MIFGMDLSAERKSPSLIQSLNYELIILTINMRQYSDNQNQLVGALPIFPIIKSSEKKTASASLDTLTRSKPLNLGH